MKLYKFVLLGIIFLSLLFGTRTTREGISAARRKEKERAAAEAKTARKADYANNDYGGVIAIQNQLILLDTIKIRLRKVPSFELEPTIRKEIEGSLDIIKNSIKSWLEKRLGYIQTNNKNPTNPLDSESIDGLRKTWINNEIGLKVLVDGITERLNIAEDSQYEVDRLLRTFVTNMNIELGIVISDTKQTDNKLGSEDLGEYGDYLTDTMDDIFGEGEFEFGFPEEENLTYEERYS
jgi:hypothetical protein